MTCETDFAQLKHDGRGVPAPGVYDVDLTFSYVGFSVRRHMVSRVRGWFRTFRGTLTASEDQSALGMVLEIDAGSVDTGDPERDAYLRSPGFLDVDRFPVMAYRSSRLWPVIAWAPDGRDRFHAEGELELHGITRPVDFEVRFEGGLIDPNGASRVGFTAHAEIMRDDFELPGNRELNTGDVVMDRKVTLELEIEAVGRT